MKILNTNQMRQVESDCANLGLSPEKLMANAGQAFAEATQRLLGDVTQQHILMLIGPGNNGGDGLVAARHLHDWGAQVSLLILGARDGDPNFTPLKQREIDCIALDNGAAIGDLAERLQVMTAVVDAFFGIGTVRPFNGIIRNILDMVSEARQRKASLPIIALDLPSGLNADTGSVDPATLYADYTVTLGCPKTGLLKPPGVERAGRIIVADIGIPDYLVDNVNSEVITAPWVAAVLPSRPLQANKGSFGRAMIAAGSLNYVGAAYLAASGAMRVGTGLVTLATPGTLQAVLAGQIAEATHLPLPESQRGVVSPGAAKLIHQYLDSYDSLLVGCGLGQSRATLEFIETLLLRIRPVPIPLVLDADAPNALARIPNWAKRLTDDAILTPHPGEMARLADISIEEVQRDRLDMAKRAAASWNKTIVLKGAYTVIATPDGRARTSLAANPGLATAGTGDVLSGIIAGLLAQGMSLFDAAAAGVYLHGAAGELVRTRLGEVGMMAGDLLPALPLAIKQLKP